MKAYDIHTHTLYCDGKNSPREMVEAAYNLGFSAIGLSGHSYTPFDDSYCMSLGNTAKYIDEINKLKEDFKGRLHVLCGIEQDYFAPLPDYKYDYMIGSVHYVEVDGKRLTIDYKPEETQAIIDTYFGGSYNALAESYFNLVGNILEVTGADIIGHFDLISKFSEVMNYHESPKYLDAGYEAIRKLIPYGKPFEINVGAMTRGYRTSPYPSAAFMSEILRLGGKITVTGDCHSVESLGKGLDAGYDFARRCGFTSVMVMTPDGFQETPLF